MRLIDTHCHWDDTAFDTDRASLLTKLMSDGVSDLVLPAISAETWPRLTAVCAQSARLHASYGLHPLYLAEHRPEHLKDLRHQLDVAQRQGQVVAVGECGLDFFLPALNFELQTQYFVAQLKLAKDFDLPVIIHARRALDQVLKQIRRVGGLRGVVHSFAGSRQQADTLIKYGFYLGIGGTVTYERAQRLRRVVATCPAEFLLLETDAPDQPDSAWRGRRNEPSRLPIIAEVVAELRQANLSRIAETTTANAQRLFGIV